MKKSSSGELSAWVSGDWWPWACQEGGPNGVEGTCSVGCGAARWGRAGWDDDRGSPWFVSASLGMF